MRGDHGESDEAIATQTVAAHDQPASPDPVAGAGSGTGQTAQPLSAVRGAATAFSDVVSVSAARGVSIGLALVSVTIVTHMLGPTKYAILAYIAVISNLMLTATASWTATTVTRYGREELEREGSIRATSWGRLVITAPLLALALVVVVLLKLADLLPRVLTWEFVAIALGSGLALIAGEHLLNLLEAAGRMKLTAVGLALSRAAAIISLVALIALGVTGSASAVALVWLAVGWVFAAALATRVWRVGMWPPTMNRELLRRMIAFSLPMIAFAISVYVIQAVDVVILGAYRPSRDVGLYAIAYQGYGALQQLATTATIVLSPLFVSLRVASREGVIARFYERIVPQTLFLTSIGAGLVASLLGLVVPLVFGHSFGPAAKPLAILLVAWTLYAGASFVASILVLHERSRAIGAINSVAAIVNVVGDLLLVGVLGVGIVGPAIVTAVSLAVITIGYFHVAADCVDRPRTLPLAMVAPAVVGAVLALAFSGGLGVAVGFAGTIGTATVVFLWKKPFAASDVDLIGRLDIPGPLKRLSVGALSRLG